MRGHLYSCEQCGKPIHEGEIYCRFYADVQFCAEHAVTRSAEITYLKWALEQDEWENVFEETPFKSRAEFVDYVERLEAALALKGDGPASPVTA